MALTASEEALVRQLLDQQAAILSLAGNEATITSKLGATKVTLADLVAASSLADADLLLTRQGTTDKSVRADILATYMGAELGALFAPIANPTFTGNVLVTSNINAASYNGGQLAGMRNLLINGNFQINQRGYVSGTNVGAANTYTLDRWRVVTSGQNVTFSASGNGNQITAPAGGIEQVIEGINIGGGTYVLNWNGTATATVNGTARAKGESFTLPANTNATVRLIGGTASQVQLEPGTVATPFEHRPIGAELALCQRYYEKAVGSQYISYTSGNVNTILTGTWAVPKRATPTMSFDSSIIATAVINHVTALGAVGWNAGVTGIGQTGATHAATVIGTAEL